MKTAVEALRVFLFRKSEVRISHPVRADQSLQYQFSSFIIKELSSSTNLYEAEKASIW